MFTLLTNLPEGQASAINNEMLIMLTPQIMSGIDNEVNNGIIADEEGNLPEEAYWQRIYNDIETIKTHNEIIVNQSIIKGKEFIKFG